MYNFAAMLRISFSAFLLVLFSGCGNVKEEKKVPVAIKEEALETPENVRPRIVFFGNSITAGYQLDPTDAFPNLIQHRIDSLNMSYECINAGLSGETTAGGVERIDWILKAPVDVFVLELGANDGLRGLPLTETEANLHKIIDKVRASNDQVKILLLGMEVPPNMGDDYAGEFRSVFKRVAESAEVAFLPFLLQGVAGDKELNLPDGIHPTEQGHKMVMENVWAVLKTML